MGDLLLPLSAAPGLDPVGLVGYVPGRGWASPGESLGALALGYGPFPSGGGSPDRDGIRVEGGTMLLERAHVSLADAATRDRVARWLAERVGLEVGATAPEFCAFRHCLDCDAWVWSLACSVRGTGEVLMHVFGPPAAAHDPEPDEIVPALASISPDDPQADWLALAAVARHVGGQGVERG